MNQPLTPAIATRAPGQTESPDILQVVRRYIWLLAAGTAVGAAVSGGLYYHFRKNYPLYKSYYQFQVLPQPNKLGDAGPLVINADDTSQFIHRQVRAIKSPRMMEEILATKEFRSKPENENRDSDWYEEHRSAPLRYLKRDLEVTPLVDSAAFELSFTCRSRTEARRLVEAAKNVYLTRLRADSVARASSEINRGDRIVKDQVETVRRLTASLNQLRQRLNVTAIEMRYTVELQQLQTLNQQALLAKNAENTAQQQLAQMTKSYEDKTLKETPEAVRYVNENGEYNQLHLQYLNYEQEKASLIAKRDASPVPIQMLEARMEENTKQRNALRETLEQRAMDYLKQGATNEYLMRKDQAAFIEDLRTKQEKLFQSLDASRNEFLQQAADLKAQEEVLQKLRIEAQYRSLDTQTDEQRIIEFASASIPEAYDFVWPNIYLFLTLGTLGGLGLSFLTAYLLALSDTRVRTPRDVTRTLQLPLLGFIPDENDDRALTGDVGMALISSPSSMVAESFRQIRSQLSAMTENSPVNTLLVASIAPGGGSTTVASNLAAGMALNERRVLLVDANFYRPNVKGLYKNVPPEGLSDVLRDPALLDSAIVASPEVPKLHILGAGSALGKASSELLEGKGFRELVERLKSKYDLVIFDGAPLNLVADSLTLAARVDGVVPVIRAGEVSRGTVSRIREQLRQVHANLLGFVLNAAQTSSSGYFKENYKTFYRYAGQGAKRPAGK